MVKEDYLDSEGLRGFSLSQSCLDVIDLKQIHDNIIDIYDPPCALAS